jgi:hypothetical protein
MSGQQGITKWLHGRRWYYRLVPKAGSNARPLFFDHPPSTTGSKMIVCLSHLDTRDDSNWRFYTVFDSYIQYLDFILALRPQQRSCFEVLTGRQKPHFDLDIDLSEIPNGDDLMLELRDLVIDACLDLIPGLDLETDMLFFTSHGNDKRSLHIIINNWYHNDNKEAREFYRQVTEHIQSATNGKYGESLYRLIDHSVYSENQNFRIVGTHKLGTSRTKVLVPQFTYKNRLYHHKFSDNSDSIKGMTSEQRRRKMALTILRESLVGFVADCQWLKIEVPQPVASPVDYDDLTEHDVQGALKLLSTYNWEEDRRGEDEWDEELFVLDKVEGNRLVLIRRLPSWCPLCKRVHIRQSPWIKVFDGRCYWHCRQYPGTTSVYLGKIPTESPKYSSHRPSEREFESSSDIAGTPILTIAGVSVSPSQITELQQSPVSVNTELQQSPVSVNTELQQSPVSVNTEPQQSPVSVNTELQQSPVSVNTGLQQSPVSVNTGLQQSPVSVNTELQQSSSPSELPSETWYDKSRPSASAPAPGRFSSLTFEEMCPSIKVEGLLSRKPEETPKEKAKLVHHNRGDCFPPYLLY